MANIDSKTLLSEIEALCQTQITRLQNQLQIAPRSPKVAGEAPISTSPAVNATPVLHAAGKRKPSLEELDSQPRSRRSIQILK